MEVLTGRHCKEQGKEPNHYHLRTVEQEGTYGSSSPAPVNKLYPSKSNVLEKSYINENIPELT